MCVEQPIRILDLRKENIQGQNSLSYPSSKSDQTSQTQSPPRPIKQPLKPTISLPLLNPFLVDSHIFLLAKALCAAILFTLGKPPSPHPLHSRSKFPSFLSSSPRINNELLTSLNPFLILRYFLPQNMDTVIRVVILPPNNTSWICTETKSSRFWKGVFKISS
jgi:hypothetical protein